MNDVTQLPIRELRPRPVVGEPARDHAPQDVRPREKRRAGGRVLGLGVLLVLAGGLTAGGWRHYSQSRATLAPARRGRDFGRSVRVAPVPANKPDIVVTLPATTLAFTSANIYARASGYIVE